MNITLKTKLYPDEGEFQHTYSPLRNLINTNGELTNFTIDIEKFPININGPLSIECQPSYDGTVNLIIADDENPIKMINTRFTKTENGRFKIINRDQLEQTNIYKENEIDSTNLVLHPKIYPKLKFKNILSSGSLEGGNYTFYMKYLDGDGNESDYVAETFQIPVYKGTATRPKTISGALVNERTDKAIQLLCTNLESSFQKIKLYYTRETSDLNGYRISKAYEILKTFAINGDKLEIIITGGEEVNEITIDHINSERFKFTSAKTQCQLQNMLFLGNISKTTYDVNTLRNVSLFFTVQCVQDESVGWVNTEDYSYKFASEYYDPENVCYKFGYWPDEFYRLGVVYILEDGSHTDVFNLRGCKFSSVNDTNVKSDSYIKNGIKQNLEVNTILDYRYYTNTYGVFQNPSLTNEQIIDYTNKKVTPLHYKIFLNENNKKDVEAVLKSCGVKGWFFVRQKRLPFTLFQGLSLHVDQFSGSPMIYDGTNYFTESFLVNATRNGANNTMRHIVQHDNNGFTAAKTISATKSIGGSALLAPDVMFNPDLQNILCGSEMLFVKQSSESIPIIQKRHLRFEFSPIKQQSSIKFPAVFVREDVPYKIVNDFQFSTRFGSAESTKSFSFFGKTLDAEGAYLKDNRSLLRGTYTSYVGVCGNLDRQCLYSVKTGDYSPAYIKQYIENRGLNHGAFFAISDKQFYPNEVNIWSGDCYTNTVTIRLNKNFVDPDAPINDFILNPDTWKTNYHGYMNMVESTKDNKIEIKEGENKGDYYKINRGDLNSAPLGMWATFKLLSSYNLGLRSEDRNNTEEMALMGSARSFYPVSSMSVTSNAKMSESMLLNSGYSATVSAKEYYEIGDVPYIKNIFDNRVVYSNIQVEDDFKNGYRVFSEIAYQDIDRQYGAIVKLLPWGTDLLCIFEHGIGILPVNQKALLQTQSGTLSLGAAGVLQSNVTLVSGDFGSTWGDSIIKTNIGVYGIDTYAKKIWRYSSQNGFEIISDMKIQRFLNDNIVLSEKDKSPIAALRNVKTHYNAYKGDVMFTFYNHLEGVEWNVCYNERLGKWITRYSWIPLCSENINNIYYSLDKKRASLLGYIAELNNNTPVTFDKFVWSDMGRKDFKTSGKLDSTYDVFTLNIVGGSTSYFDESDHEHFIDLTREEINSFCTWFKSDAKNGTLTINNDRFWKWLHSKFPIRDSEVITGAVIDKNNYIDEAGNFDGEKYKEDKEKAKQEYNADIERYAAELRKDSSWTPDDPEELKKFNKYLEWQNYDSTKDEEHFVPKMPLYLKIDVEISTTYKGYTPPTPLKKSIVVLSADEGNKDYDKMLVNGFYVHGRAGIFDEINYKDNDSENQIQPTKWYDKQEPFEFEFVINSPVGIHKIFDNLVIISNNVQPNSIEYTIEGDTYSLFKNDDLFSNNKKRQLYLSGVGFKNAKLNYDTILNQYSLTIHQDCKNIADPKYGRRLGNIQYKEDSWYATIEPLVFDPLLKASPEDQKAKWTSTRIRDKFLKVRVKYTGEDLVIITAIKNLCTLSRA